MKPLFDNFEWMKCNEESGGESACFGTGVLLRMSFALLFFHIHILLMIVPRLPCSAAYHDGCWIFKFILILTLFICMFWIPNSFFKVYAYIARFMSGFFLVIQVFLILIIAYSINEHLVYHHEQAREARDKGKVCGTGFTLLGLTIVMSLGQLTWLVFLFIWFHDCAVNVVLLVLTLVFLIAFYGLIFLRTRSDASVFTSSIVGVYIVYIAWSALGSGPNGDCNPY